MCYTTKDNPSSNSFQYLFQNDSEYKGFITKMAENDFRSTDPVKQDKFGGQFVQSLYIKSNKTISLGVFKMKKRFEYYLLTYFQNPKN